MSVPEGSTTTQGDPIQCSVLLALLGSQIENAATRFNSTLEEVWVLPPATLLRL